MKLYPDGYLMNNTSMVILAMILFYCIYHIFDFFKNNQFFVDGKLKHNKTHRVTQ